MRTLEAVETLGSVQVFCMDKTGTLTQNRMAVVAVYGGQDAFALIDRQFRRGDTRVDPMKREELVRMMRGVSLCSEVEINGTAEKVRLSEQDRDAILDENDRMAGNALRVLASAYREMDGDQIPVKAEKLTWLGLAGMADPMRTGMDKLIAQYHRAGIGTIMIVAAGLAGECEVQLSYSIGAAAPVSLRVRTFSTSEVDDKEIAARLTKAIDFRLGAIVRDLRLQKLPAEKDGFYEKLAVYGHMERVDLDAPWEQTDKVGSLT